MSAGLSNATALIKIDDDEIARGQFDECRYPLNYRSRIGAEDAAFLRARGPPRDFIYLSARGSFVRKNGSMGR